MIRTTDHYLAEAIAATLEGGETADWIARATLRHEIPRPKTPPDASVAAPATSTPPLPPSRPSPANHPFNQGG